MDYNFSFNLQQAIERAIYIAEDCEDDELCTYHVAMAVLIDEDSILQRLHIETGYKIDVSTMIASMMNQKEIYEKITGKEFPQNESEEPKEEENNLQNDQASNQNSSNITQNYYLVLGGSDDSRLQYNNIPYSQNLTLAFEDAYARCSSNGKQYVDEENLLFSILSIEDSTAYKLLSEFKFDIPDLRDMLLLNGNIYQIIEDDNIKLPKALENFCEILNEKYTKGQKCDILCRDKEIFLVWNIFSKKNKKNAILVGGAGVGKTAIAEAITMQIVNETCPEEFKGYTVISLNLNGMVAGTKYRGEFEIKVEQFIKFLKLNKKVIIFVDEIHQILGTGNAEGSGPDLSGSLKPILARDDVIFIGATTTDEYERYFSLDPAFRRRFEIVTVEEPKLKDVRKMIELKVKNLSTYHNISISNNLLKYVIITAKAMNISGSNPDLTIDLLDRSMSIAKIRGAKRLTKNDVDKVFEKNYDVFKGISQKDKLLTAYHEAGHALLKLLAKYDKREELKIVSIIPTEKFLGITISEPNGKFSPITKQAVLEKASMSLAGRVAQEFVNKDWDFGASSDLEAATQIIRDMIIENGMDSEIYKNISLYDYKTNGNIMSPQAIDMVNHRIEEIMKDVYNDTKELIIKNKDKLEIIVDLLMKKGIISVEEIVEAFRKEDLEV